MAVQAGGVPSWKKLSLFSLTWPIFVEIVLRMMLGTSDVFMLSRLSDGTAGAVGLANEIIYFCITMFGFVAIGTSVAVTQYLGAGRSGTATRIAAQAITMNLLFGVLISVVVAAFGPLLLQWMKLDAAFRAVAEPYLAWIGAFLWIEAVSYAVSSVLRAQGHTREAMFVTLGVNVMNVAGNFLLIFGHFGFPELGVLGAAVSTVASRAVGLVVLLALMYRVLPSRIRLRDYLAFDPLHTRQILRVGVPAAGEHLAWQSQHMMILTFVNIIGMTALTTHVYVFNISAYFLALSYAVGMGTEIIVGHMVGAGALGAAYRRLMRSLRVSLVLTLGVVGVAALFRRDLIGLFTTDPAIIAVGSTILLLSLVLEPGRTFNLVVINALRAAGDARFPVVVGVASMWGVSVPLAYLLGVTWKLGLVGVWVAFAVDEWLRGVLMLLRWRSRVWERKTLVQADDREPAQPAA